MQNNRMIGRIWIVGDHIDTDQIVPSRVLTENNPEKMVMATLELVIPHFATQVKSGDILLAGKNFGCGSSREEAVFVLKTLGIKAVIARSFARIFYRNMINLGLLPLICPELQILSEGISNLGKTHDILEIDLDQNLILNQDTKFNLQIEKLPPHILNIWNAGGAIELLKQNNSIF